MTIYEQLSATGDKLVALSNLVAAAPELFEFASIAQIDPECARVYIHANTREAAQKVDWHALAMKYRRANWQRKMSPACGGRYDWDGVLDGVEVSILGAEVQQQPMPLFAVEGAAA